MAKHRVINVGLLAAAFLSLFWWTGAPAQAASVPSGWRDKGVDLPARFANGNICFDGNRPGLIWSSNSEPRKGEIGSTLLDLNTGQITGTLTTYNLCNEYNGLIYNKIYKTNSPLTTTLFDKTGGAALPLDHAVTHFALDGTLQTYSLEYVELPVPPSTIPEFSTKLFASPDGGLTWVQRGQILGSKITSLVVSPTDGRALYAMVLDKADQYAYFNYTIYFSPDAGLTWEKRGGIGSGGCYTTSPTGHGGLISFKNNNMPINYIAFGTNNTCGGSGNATDYYLSTDGGRSFIKYANISESQAQTTLLTNSGLVRLTTHIYRSANQDLFNLDLSSDGGKSWQPSVLPYSWDWSNNGKFTRPYLRVIPDAPSNLLLGNDDGSGDLWLSQDGGKKWQKLGANLPLILVSPYSPSYTLVGIKDNHVYTMDLPIAAKTHTLKAVPNNAPGGDFFVETQHNLGGIFQKYFYENGGVARFGFPKTEPFREYNPSDGKIYTVQYFERGRFEYHPENRGTPYEVLLGLLGVQLTDNYRANGHGAFNRFSDMHYPGGTYFPITGHNLRNSFKAYWEANGGLASYGYPISEEFNEVNPDDGKTYVVQYFERTRFEWHPENAGTPYEVLLGLFGNALLRQKGW